MISRKGREGRPRTAGWWPQAGIVAGVLTTTVGVFVDSALSAKLIGAGTNLTVVALAFVGKQRRSTSSSTRD